MLAHIWGHTHVAQVKKNGPASEVFLLVHFTGRSAPVSQPNYSPRQALASASSRASTHVLGARFGAGTTENGYWEFRVVGGGWPLGRNWTYLAIYAPAAVITRNA